MITPVRLLMVIHASRFMFVIRSVVAIIFMTSHDCRSRAMMGVARCVKHDSEVQSLLGARNAFCLVDRGQLINEQVDRYLRYTLIRRASTDSLTPTYSCVNHTVVKPWRVRSSRQSQALSSSTKHNAPTSAQSIPARLLT